MAQTRKYVWVIILYTVLGIIGSAFGLLSTVLSKNIIDIVTKFRHGELIFIAIVYVAMKLGVIVLNAITSLISARVQLKVNQEMRRNVFDKVLSVQWENISEYHSGDILSRISRDTETVASNIITWFPSAIINIIQFVATFFLIMYYDATLALLALISAPIIFVTSSFFAKKIRKYSKETREIGAEMLSFHNETIQNLQIIKSFDITDSYRNKLLKKQEKQKKAILDHNKFSVFSSSFMSLVGMIVGGLCFFWSVYRLLHNQITFGEMVLFLQLAGMLSGSFNSLVSLVPTAITIATSAGRVMAVTQLPKETLEYKEETDKILSAGKCAVHLQIDSMDFSYQSGNSVFHNAKLEASPGEIIALVGPSGGGKTTMLRILLGLVSVEKGKAIVHCDEPEININISPSTRRLFAYVPQDNTLFSGTVADNLRVMKPDASDEELEEVLKIACAYDFVTKLPDGINTILGERGNGLSEGQIQRISIARALLCKAPILLFDEATSALDIDTEHSILRNITKTQKNRTCIVTTHRPSVLELCNRVYHINDETVTQMSENDIQKIVESF